MKKKLIFLGVLLLSVLWLTPAMALEIVRQKNAATIIYFPINDGAGARVVSAAGLDSELDTWSDGGAPDGFTDADNEATESDAAASGWYYLSLTQAEMNYDYISVRVYSSTAGTVTQNILIRTIVGDPLNVATTDDGSTINVTAGAIDTVTTTTTATTATTCTDVTNLGGTAAATQINNQVKDVIVTDTYAEIGAGAPSATPTLAYMLTSLYEYLMRNKVEVTATSIKLYKDDGTTEVFHATMADDGTTFTRSEFVAP